MIAKVKFTFIFFIIMQIAFSQRKEKTIETYNNDDFFNHRLLYQNFDMWSIKNVILPKHDTVTYYVDVTNYKGIINYGIDFSAKDKKVVNFNENYNLHYLDIKFSKCNFSTKDSILEIEGVIKGGTGFDASKDGKLNMAEIAVGELQSHKYVLNFYPEYYFPDIYNIKYKGVEKLKCFTLDTLPSFFYKNDSFRKSINETGFFKFKAKITESSVLSIGKFSYNTEFFNIGKMVYTKNKNNVKYFPEKRLNEFKKIIENNIQISEVVKKHEDKTAEYYQLTEKAENHILKRQYGTANETYLLLNKKYPIIFARDIHNAIRCAVLSRDYKNAFFWGEKLANKGINIKYFDADIFSNLKKNIDWGKFKTRFDSIYNENKNKINLDLKLKLEQLLEEDQADYGLASRKESQILYETTVRITDKLIELLKNEGYPSEEKIGVYKKNDTILNFFPSYNVLIRHAIQQKPENLNILLRQLDKSIDSLEYDSKRSPNNIFIQNSCFHIYKGNLYNSKSCGANDMMIKKIKFIFNNPYNFIIHNDNYVITEYDKENPEEYDKYYNENFSFIMKLTDNWEFYMEE